MRSVILSSALLVLLASGAAADKKLKSGLQPGDSASPFNVLDCTGPNKGRKLCYR